MNENAQLFRQYIEGFMQGGDETVAERLVDENVLTHDGLPGQEPGLNGVKQTFRALRTAFPDLAPQLQDLIAEGDKVVARFVVTGTHTGDFLGMPPTGRAFSYDEITIVRFRDGKIVEHWAEMDSLGMMQQLGALG
ncbi:MAG TPA: ester cyclase [Microbacterium sp.]|nr:ester cyclase [Microbacterium sp.]